MQSLPDELVLWVVQYLSSSLVTLRRLRLVSRRLFRVVAQFHPKPLIIYAPMKADKHYVANRLTEVGDEVYNTRALLININNNDTFEQFMGPWSENHSFITRPAALEFVSLTAGPLLAEPHGSKKGVDFMSTTFPLGDIHHFKSLTHFESHGFFPMYMDKLHLLPLLTEVSFCNPRCQPQYSLLEVRSAIHNLQNHAIVSFTMSVCFDSTYDLTTECTRMWPKLRALSFCTESSLSNRKHQLRSLGPRERPEHFPPSFRQKVLKQLALSLCPVGVCNTATVSNKGRVIGLGPISDRSVYSFWENYPWLTTAIYESDAIEATKGLIAVYPSLKLVGWLVPTSERRISQVWCRLKDDAEEDTWECITNKDEDSDCWPVTDMDIVFS